ncbi:hypothetical protein CSW98_05285 [Vibrio sp. HA2012]|nr:hypothetical protein CSW98_05285 [Vibrio sp. HA2012]
MLQNNIWLVFYTVSLVMSISIISNYYLFISRKKIHQQKNNLLDKAKYFENKNTKLAKKFEQSQIINTHLAGLGLDCLKYNSATLETGSPQYRLRTLLEQMKSISADSMSSSAQEHPVLIHQWVSSYSESLTEEFPNHNLQIQYCPDLLAYIDTTWLAFAISTIYQHSFSAGTSLYLIIQESENSPQHLSLQFSNTSSFYVSDKSIPPKMSVEMMLLQQKAESLGGALDYQVSDAGQWMITIRFCCSYRTLPSPGEVFPLGTLPVAPDESPLLLLLSADTDLSNWLIEQLSDCYRVVTCGSLKGLEHQIEESEPDLILSSLILPDGETINWMNQQKLSGHPLYIPFILISDNNDISIQYQVWQNLADDFISHPININILKLRLNAIVANRNRLQQYLLSLALPSQTLTPPMPECIPGTMSMGNQQEQEFASRLQKELTNLITTGGITTELLAEKMYISSRSLQRKIKELFGITCTQYIRSLQFQLAVEKMQQGATIKEAALTSGFRDQAYFSRVFKNEYKITPSEFKKKLEKGDRSSPVFETVQDT